MTRRWRLFPKYALLIITLVGAMLITSGAIGGFTKDISSGKGFIALAAVIFGRWSPRGADGAQLRHGAARRTGCRVDRRRWRRTLPCGSA